MNARRCYLPVMSMSNALGDHAAVVWSALTAALPRWLSRETGWLDDATPVFVGRVQCEPPLLDSSWLSFASRNNALLAACFAGIAAATKAAREKFGATRIGVVLGTSTSGIAEAEVAFAHARRAGQFPADFRYTQQELGSPSAFLARLAGIAGPSFTVSTACTSSGKAIAAARRLIRSGLCDAVVAGGVDTLCKLTIRGFAALEATSRGIAQPFSRHRDGINLGEGAALFLVTREPCAIELMGVGEASDAHHISAPDPAGRGAEAAVRAALADADCAAGEIAYVNLHGTGTPLNDAMESAMMARVFGPEGVAASSTKPLTGHLLGAAAATELAFCWLALSGYNAAMGLPLHHWDGERDSLLEPLALVSAEARLTGSSTRRLMSNSFAFGGSNVSLIIGDAR